MFDATKFNRKVQYGQFMDVAKTWFMILCLTLALLVAVGMMNNPIHHYPSTPFGGGGGGGFQVTVFDPVGWLGQKLSDFIDWLTPTCCPGIPSSSSDGFGGGGGGGF